MTERPEAPMRDTDAGREPAGPGWYVLNLRDSAYTECEGYGRYAPPEPEDAEFAQFGVGVHVLMPGEPNGLYHGEENQEAFFVLSGECLLIVEGEERHLRQWDFFHCPAWTRHIFVGAGEGPCAIFMVGAREKSGLVYPVDPVAARHRASAAEETAIPREAYGERTFRPAPYRPGSLA
ncbi:MAG: cupin protein [Solirubrobacterales bacterium]|jgi:uncharacterized cupin superfamily protein|nr:cupin protein [Solirubrobacterales bacterium]